jgi:hypothetical protein
VLQVKDNFGGEGAPGIFEVGGIDGTVEAM